MSKPTISYAIEIAAIVLAVFMSGLSFAKTYGSHGARLDVVESRTESLAPAVIELRVVVAALTEAVETLKEDRHVGHVHERSTE